MIADLAARGDGCGLAMSLACEVRGAHVGNPDLDRTKSLGAEPATVLAIPFQRCRLPGRAPHVPMLHVAHRPPPGPRTTVGPVFVKICGITRLADAIAAAAAGADAIGLNFVPESQRRIDLTTARTIVDSTPTGVRRVGVFRNHSAAEILDAVAALGLDGAQLHGNHPPEETIAIVAKVPMLILAMTVDDLRLRSLDHHPEHVLMLDGPASGSGRTFDWSTLDDLGPTHRVLLAGGLTPDNVAEAVRRVRPWGVDVATGVETAPGLKASDAVSRFVSRARIASEVGSSIDRAGEGDRE